MLHSEFIVHSIFVILSYNCFPIISVIPMFFLLLFIIIYKINHNEASMLGFVIIKQILL